MNNYLIESLILGLSVGPVCLAYCGPILVPLLSSSDSPKISVSSITLLLFLFGRLSGYILIGIIVGFIGNNIKHYTNGTILGTISIVLGLTLVYFSIQKSFPESKLCRLTKNINSQKMFSIMLGFLTGLNLCPPFFAAIIGAANTGTISGSVLYFSAFFTGTIVFFPIMIIFGLLSKIDSVKTIANICMMLSGIWFFMKGLFYFFSN